jgi:DNA-binding MarR family transcriptional regulator
MQKLEDVGWAMLTRSENDGRVVLLMTTPNAKSRLTSLDKELQGCRPSTKTAQEHTTVEEAEQGSFDLDVE